MTAKEYFLKGFLTPTRVIGKLCKATSLDIAYHCSPLFYWSRNLGADHQIRLAFFASQGIEPELAWTLQPLIGAFDILMALLLLKSPNRTVLIWMFLWALWTAILRPLAGNLEKVQVDGEWAVQLATDSMRVAKMQTWEFWERRVIGGHLLCFWSWGEHLR